jgi:hypothetical protein
MTLPKVKSAAKSKVLAHVDRDQIIAWLSDGKTPEWISKTLTDKYPGGHNQHNRISMRVIYDFKNQFMPSGKLSKIAIEESVIPKWAKINADTKAELMKSSAYRDAIVKLGEEELNMKRELIQLMGLVKDRMQFYFDKLSDGDKMDERNEKVLLEQMKMLLAILQQHDNSERADAALVAASQQSISVNINIVKDHAGIIRDAVRETLESVDPNLSIEFMERLNIKMKELEYTEQTGIIPLGAPINVK